MNTFDQALFLGFLLGVTASATLALGLWLSRNEDRDTILPISDDDGPFRPTHRDGRLVRVCGACHRYLGDSRTITAGQHLDVLPDLCTRCAKHRANVSAANLKTEAL